MPGKKFAQPALLKVYLERAELERLVANAKANGKTLTGYAREILTGWDTAPYPRVPTESTPYRAETPLPNYIADVPRGDRRERARTPGRFKQAVDVAYEGVRKLETAAPTVGEAFVPERHTAESNRLTCLCPSCADYRHKNDLPVGGLPKKEKRR